MTDYESCEVKRVFKETKICPYCKKEYIQEKHVETGSLKTKVWIGSLSHNINICREDMLLVASGYTVTEGDFCYSCEEYKEDVEDYDVDYLSGEIKKYCGRYPTCRDVSPLGNCEHYKRKETHEEWTVRMAKKREERDKRLEE